MTEQLAAERYTELITAMREREEAQRKVAALDKRISELAGLTTESQRKSAKKTFSPQEFSRGCGI